MKVEIVSCSFGNYWYSDRIGQIFEVEQHPRYENSYRLIDGFFLIKKGDCKEVFEVIHKTKGKIEVIESSEFSYRIAGKAELVWKSYCQKIKQEKEMKQEFTKSDLKNFMRVKYRDGQMRIFIDGRFYGAGVNLNHTGKYSNELKHKDDLGIDIVAVYSEPPTEVLNEGAFGKLIWERKEKSEQEIELEKLQEQIKALEKQAQKLKDAIK